jgi:hypothetical protein
LEVLANIRGKHEIECVVREGQGFCHGESEAGEASRAANGIDGVNALKSPHQHFQLEPLATAQLKYL